MLRLEVDWSPRLIDRETGTYRVWYDSDSHGERREKHSAINSRGHLITGRNGGSESRSEWNNSERVLSEYGLSYRILNRFADIVGGWESSRFTMAADLDSDPTPEFYSGAGSHAYVQPVCYNNYGRVEGRRAHELINGTQQDWWRAVALSAAGTRRPETDMDGEPRAFNVEEL